MGLISEYDNICVICGKPKECTHHLIGGTANRKISDDDLIYISLCNDCHNMASDRCERIHGNPMAEKLSKMLGQMAWEKQQIIEGKEPKSVREDFRKRYGKSFL